MQKKEGISLIVLVITIIVMIILAAAIILSLNNAGIIGNANKAVEMTNNTQLRHIAELGWAEAYSNKVRDVEGLRAGVIAALEANNLNPEDYGIIVTTKGVDIVNGWIQDKTKIMKGSKIIEVGDFINYDESNNNTVTFDTDVKWKILGANEKGEVLIVSADNIIESYTLGSNTDIKKAEQDYITYKEKLNGACELYGKGKGATSVRSIKQEDIDRITGYNPFKTGDGDVAGKDKTYEHNTLITLYWTGNSTPHYKTSNNLEEDLNTDHLNKFLYFDGNKFITSDNTGATKQNPIEITTMRNQYTVYKAVTLTEDLNDEKVGLKEESKEYKMIFENGNNSDILKYWLANTIDVLGPNCVCYSVAYVANGAIGGKPLIYSEGTTDKGNYGIRAVVSLNKDLSFSWNDTTGWNY